eukprot:6226381-Alexandrium_andersonii.AAC.1
MPPQADPQDAPELDLVTSVRKLTFELAGMGARMTYCSPPQCRLAALGVSCSRGILWTTVVGGLITCARTRSLSAHELDSSS